VGLEKKDGDIVTVFEAVGTSMPTAISDIGGLVDIEEHSIPRRRLLRRHVHREHNGQRDRGASACRCRTVAPSPPLGDDKMRDCFDGRRGR